MNNANLKCENGFIPQKYISNNFEKLSLTEAQSSEKLTMINKNISKIDINEAAEMFVHLNSCPSFHVRLFWSTVYGAESRMALLASNIIKKGSDDFKIKAIKIMAKIIKMLGFKHIFYEYDGSNEKGIKTMKDINVTDKELLQKVSNHPVHLLNNEGKFSPTSFIPFCSFGEEFIGPKVDEFDIPICNIFKQRIYHDQFCYETDLQELRDSNNNGLEEEQLEMGLTLVLDYNEERQNYYNFNAKDGKKSLNHHGDSVSIYLDTISRELFKGSIFRHNIFHLAPVGLFGEGQYNLHSMKEISVTDSFLGLDREKRNCQTIESLNDCNTRIHLENLRQECGCLPLSLWTKEV